MPKGALNFPELERLYNDGLSDRAIGRALELDQSTVSKWRNDRGLPINFHPNSVRTSPQQLRLARKMLKQGASKDQVAKETKIERRTIQKIRKTVSEGCLRQPGQRAIVVRNKAVATPGLERRIKTAVASRSLVEAAVDAFGDLYTDVLDGLVAIEAIEQVGPSYRNRAASMCGSRFGPRSLDEDLGDGFTLMDTLEDADALEALEMAAEGAWQHRDD